MGIYLIPIRYLVLILLTIYYFPMFYTFQTSSLHWRKLSEWWLKKILKKYLSIFIS